jgi:hypothetical protein
VRWNIKINEEKTQAIYFSHRFRPPEAHLTVNGRNIPFVKHVKYLGVIFDKRIILRLHIEMIEAKAFKTFISIYSLFKSQRLSANINRTIHKSPIRSVMTYACPAWEVAADTYLLKLQCLKNEVLLTIGNFPRCTPVRDLHPVFNLSYVYDYINNCAGNKQMSYKIIRIKMFSALDKAKPDIENIRCINLEAFKLTNVQVTKPPL